LAYLIYSTYSIENIKPIEVSFDSNNISYKVNQKKTPNGNYLTMLSKNPEFIEANSRSENNES